MNKKMRLFVCVVLVMAMLIGCSNAGSNEISDDQGEKQEYTNEKVELTLWRGQGTDGEEALHEEQVKEFNKQSENIEIKEEVFPYNEFTNTVRAATSTNSLPDIMFMDGTVVANMAYLDAIVPVDEHIDENIKDKFTDSAFVRYDGSIYGLNEQEGGLALWANKDHLTKTDVRIPTYEKPWTKDEFKDVLSKLKEIEEVEYPLDMKTNWGGDYVIYAWQPIIRSFGGNWWDEETHKVEGYLDGDKVVDAYNYINDLVAAGYINNKQTEDTCFIDRESSLCLTGHWDYATFKPELGEDLMLVPIPDFGEGSYTGVGGISFTVSRAAEDKGVTKQAMEFINFALGDSFQEKINEASGALPANLEILKTLDIFKEDGDLYLYTQQLEGGRFVVRPESPFFPTFQDQIGKATMDILVGSDVKERLTEAAQEIQQVAEEENISSEE